MLGVPREVLQRYLYGSAMPEAAPEDDVLPQDIADDELAAAMAEPPPPDPMADLRRRYLEAQREGESRDAANAIASQFSNISANLARNLGLSSSPIVQRQTGLQDAPTRALERQLAQEATLGRASESAAARAAAMAARERELAQGAERLGLQREEAARKGAQGERALNLREEEWKGRSEIERRKLERGAEEFAKTLGLRYSELSQERQLAIMNLIDRQAARDADTETQKGKDAAKDSDYEQSVAVPDLERVPNAPKIKPEQAQKVRDADGVHESMLGAIDDLIALKKEYGRENIPTLVAEDMKSLRGSLLTMMKSAESLGSLDLGVERVAATQLPDEGTLGPYAVARLERWRKTLIKQHSNFLRKNGYRRPGSAPTAQPAPRSTVPGATTSPPPAPLAQPGSVTVLINGKPLPRKVPREKLEALKQKAAANGDKVEVQDG